MPNKKKKVKKQYKYSPEAMARIQLRVRAMEYMMLVHEEGEVLYYVSSKKKLYKSMRNPRSDAVIRLPVTEEDYKKIDIEYWYEEKFEKWRKANMSWFTSYK